MYSTSTSDIRICDLEQRYLKMPVISNRHLVSDLDFPLMVKIFALFSIYPTSSLNRAKSPCWKLIYSNPPNSLLTKSVASEGY
jgi:hypothetical protein